MSTRLRPEDLSFVETAPLTYVFEAQLDAPRQIVFEAISADPSTWTWFPGLRSGSYEGEGPHGVGSIREVSMSGTRYRETMLAWDEPSLWVYRVDSSSAPIADAIVEEWSLREHRDGTIVRLTFAIDPKLMFTAGRPAASALMGSLFRRAMRNLDAELSRRSSTSTASSPADQ